MYDFYLFVNTSEEKGKKTGSRRDKKRKYVTSSETKDEVVLPSFRDNLMRYALYAGVKWSASTRMAKDHKCNRYCQKITNPIRLKTYMKVY